VSSHARLTRSGAMLATALGTAVMLASLLPSIVLAAGPVTHYITVPSPIATAGTLTANTTKTVTVQAKDATTALVPGAVVYLSFSPTAGGGSASVGTTALTATAAAFTAVSGKITVTYKTPAVLPTGGKDILKAANAKTGATITASDFYSFSKAATYSYDVFPIAPSGTISPGSSTPIVLTALDAGSLAVPGATVYLSFTKPVGGGTATVGATLLTSTPAPFVANGSGQIAITYHAPASLPTSGTDSISATDALKNPTVTRTDNYLFAVPASYALSPTPIAAKKSLTAGKTVSVTFTVFDAAKHPIAGALVWLTFVPATKGGTAKVGSKALSATPERFLTGSAGTVTITYKTPTKLPTTGLDTINAANLKVGPTLSASDTYSY
jgi:hypothetical protein